MSNSFGHFSIALSSPDVVCGVEYGEEIVLSEGAVVGEDADVDHCVCSEGYYAVPDHLSMLHVSATRIPFEFQ